MDTAEPNRTWLLPKARMDDLLLLLRQEGYEVIAPRIEQGAIVYGPVASAGELPVGWTDRQAPGSYRLERRSDAAWFGYAVGPHSWKRYLFPPERRLFEARRTEDGFEVRADDSLPPRRAFLGLRACELHALAVQDRVFLNRQGISDPYYAAGRQRLFLIAVECEAPAGTCFCTSMGTGPEVRPERIPLLASRHEEAARQSGSDYAGRRPLPLAAAAPPHPLPPCDLVLTELDDGFVVRAISAAGQGLAERLNLSAATSEESAEAARRVAVAAQAVARRLDVADVRDLLQRNLEHPRWDDVANRCLACTNCTLVCPTCFCSCTEDVSGLDGDSAARIRRWDSCFNPEFGRVHGGNFRPSIRGRYRQWLTHKFASWFDQFDLSGCVGCGRCITWCPVGIDVTEEIAAIRAADGQTTEVRP